MLKENNYACSFPESDSIKIGEFYRAKVFLANNTLKKYMNGNPIIKFSNKETSYEDLIKNGKTVSVFNDTGYVKFKVENIEQNKLGIPLFF